MDDASPVATTTAMLDEQLMSLIRRVADSQDRDAFDKLYSATAARLYTLAMRITHDHDLAEEVVSDVYVQVWKRAASYNEQRGNAIAWLSVMCRSRALDALRKDKMRRRLVPLDENCFEEMSDELEPIDILVTVERGSAVHKALSQLSIEQRQAIGLVYFRGYTHQELANYLDMPLGTVKTHLLRAIRKLRELTANNPALMTYEHD